VAAPGRSADRVVPIANLEWIQKTQPVTNAERGYLRGESDTILRAMPDYINKHLSLPHISRT